MVVDAVGTHIDTDAMMTEDPALAKTMVDVAKETRNAHLKLLSKVLQNKKLEYDEVVSLPLVPERSRGYKRPSSGTTNVGSNRPHSGSASGSRTNTVRLATDDNSSVGSTDSKASSRSKKQQKGSKPGSRASSRGASRGGSSSLRGLSRVRNAKSEEDNFLTPAQLHAIELAKADKNYVIPPFHPSLGLKMPLLPKLFIPDEAEARLEVLAKRRMEHSNYRIVGEGPTFESCWVVPGKVAMGKLPHGKAHKKSSTPAVSALLLGGIHTFVSLLPEQEEAELEASLKLQCPLEDTLRPAVTGARYAVDQVLLETTQSLEEQNSALKEIPYLSKDDPGYAKANNDRLRRLARIRLISESQRKAKQQLDRLPTRAEWFRAPLVGDVSLTVQDLLMALWKIEACLAAGNSVYLYSREGHGRCVGVSMCIEIFVVCV